MNQTKVLLGLLVLAVAIKFFYVDRRMMLKSYLKMHKNSKPANGESVTISTDELPKGNLVIHVETWHEGIAGWKNSLSQVLLMAKTLNAQIVL